LCSKKKKKERSMKTPPFILSLLLLWPSCALRAQLQPPNEAGVTLGHFHTIVRDVAASEKFWTSLGGKALTIDGTTVMKFPGVFVFLTKGNAVRRHLWISGESRRIHGAERRRSNRKWKADGVTAEYLPSAYVPTVKLGYAYTPDDLKVSLTGTNPWPIRLPAP